MSQEQVLGSFSRRWASVFGSFFFEPLRQIRLSSIISFELDVRSFVWVYRVYRFSVFQFPNVLFRSADRAYYFFLNRPKGNGDGSLVDTYSIGVRIWSKIASYMGIFSSNTEINL